MSDAFLTLAYSEPDRLSCFLVPRWKPDGERNPFFIQRLKDKLGNRSNASSEIEYADTWARMLGEQGRGVATILEMVHHTRLDTAVAAAGLMRQALLQALHHAAHRSAFGRRLIEQPLMRNVLADLALECEAATALALRVGRSFDEAGAGGEQARAFGRIATAIAKYWLNKRAPGHVSEALECLGGAGYVEESILPRLYREAPLNGIWEGSGNVICLDVLRVLQREPHALVALFAELELARGADRRLDAAVQALRAELEASGAGSPGGSASDLAEERARSLVEAMA
jgi:putative acyl-CoA dehydrogenase